MRALVVALIVALGVVSAVHVARADGNATVGVVVNGEATMQAPLVAQLESWLRGHGHQLQPTPLPPDAINRLVDCLVLEDQSCARNLIDQRARTESLIFARVEVSPGDAGRDITLTAYWFIKGHNAIAERRVCERCSQDTLRGTVDSVMTALAGSAVTSGRVKLRSDPAGMLVMLDNASIGATPLERDIPAGVHTITLTHGGLKVGERKITVRVGEVAEITIPVTHNDTIDVRLPHDTPLGPKIAVGGMILGGAALVAGTVMIVAGGDPKNSPTYRDFRTPGIGVTLFGAAVSGAAVYLWFRGDHTDSTPVASVTPQGAYFGWSRSY